MIYQPLFILAPGGRHLPAVPRLVYLHTFIPSQEPGGNLRPGHDTPSADDVVGVTGEEGLAIGGPGQADALGVTALLSGSGELGLQLIDLALLLKVEDDDAAGGGSAQPVSVGGEDEGVDLVVGIERVQVLALVKIPQHGGTVLATGSAEGAIGGDGDGVDVAGVAAVVGLQLAGGQLPNLLTLYVRTWCQTRKSGQLLCVYVDFFPFLKKRERK